ncbi:hypothetical protein [Nocardiopsis composta]|uniref:Transcriptional regulator with XRE-family HTH domain/DNA-binding phage protein n=1 Tax=Nocardiopsis composta TaxID=157465 RepID=A0A7W8QKX7_9ACTN|nr:hypothetical protein [Nocardiopsis composta]MBB5431391.1 transcriptional regulator with XRE-family HTH domain/DNA-binding phage protein [Nocardiopsis composta]
MSTHGTRARYVAGCRCDACRTANRTYNSTRNRAAVYGRPTTDLVDAAPAREHVRALMAAGMGTRAIAEAAGIERKSVQRLLNGRPDRGNPPPTRITPQVSAALLALAPAPAAAALVDATGTKRRLQALISRGWAQAQLAARLGMAPTNFGTTLRGERVLAGTARQVRELYDELWDVAPPETTRRERISASRARRYAAVRGWVPPMAWDDDTIEDPAAVPDLGEEVLRREAVAEDAAELAAQGLTREQIAARLGVGRTYIDKSLTAV